MQRLFTVSSFALMLMLSGCGQTSTSTPTANTATESRPQAKPKDAALDLSIPLLEPKPVIWFDTWAADGSPPESVSEARETAILSTNLADVLKAQREYDKAAIAYKSALDADPTYAYASYQLACNYELSRRHDKARDAFQQAIDSGFDDFPTALTDDELGTLRETRDFGDSLVAIRERYIKSRPERLGQPIAIRPESIRKPAAGYPVIIMLHGYGDSNTSFLDEAKAWTESAFVAVTLPGSLPNGRGGFIWSTDSFEPTRRAVQAVVQSDTLAPFIDRENVFLLGFSQGALHALLLTSLDADQYAGVVAMSPGGPMADRMKQPFLNRTGTAKIAFIHGSREAHAPIARAYERECQSNDWPFMGFTHRGGHHFPADWELKRRKVIRFFTQGIEGSSR